MWLFTFEFPFQSGFKNLRIVFKMVLSLNKSDQKENIKRSQQSQIYNKNTVAPEKYQKAKEMGEI